MLELALDVLTGAHLTRGDFATWKGNSARLEGEGEVWVRSTAIRCSSSCRSRSR